VAPVTTDEGSSANGRYTCAELVVTAYQQAGVRLIPEKDVDEIAPGDLARLLPADSLSHR
jgi:hypothetical protein